MIMTILRMNLSVLDLKSRTILFYFNAYWRCRKACSSFQKLIEIGTLFSDAKDWSPSEIVRHYRDKGLIRGNYLRIAWRNKQDLNITTE